MPGDNSIPRRLPFPWMTAPSGKGGQPCLWCGRMIYMPAVPCSEAVIRGLSEIEASLGMGERCRWEIRTRGVGANAEPEQALAELERRSTPRPENSDGD